jgi:hypothetical protein
MLRSGRLLATLLVSTLGISGGSGQYAAHQPSDDCDLPRIVIDIYNDPL